jgi:hypothetical protein
VSLTRICPYPGGHACGAPRATHASEILEQFELVLNTISMRKQWNRPSGKMVQAPPKRQHKPNWRKTTELRRLTREGVANSGEGLAWGQIAGDLSN